jgi:hypothetical protein
MEKTIERFGNEEKIVKVVLSQRGENAGEPDLDRESTEGIVIFERGRGGQHFSQGVLDKFNFRSLW